MIKINYLDERKLVVKREIDTEVAMPPKANDTQVLPDYKACYTDRHTDTSIELLI